MKKLYILLIAIFILNNIANAQCGWTTINNGTKANDYLGSVYFTDVNTGYAVGFSNYWNSGLILKTTDGGANWASHLFGTGFGINILKSVYFTDAKTGYAVGYENSNTFMGEILKTTDGGLNWTEQTSGHPTSDLYSVYFTDAYTGYIVGYAGVILKTNNCGANWTPLNCSYTSYDLYSVYFTDANTGYAVGNDDNNYKGIILKTTDSGANWTAQVNISNCDLYSIYFADAYTGYAVGVDGNGGKILKTTNGGKNWISQTSGTTNCLFSVYFTDNYVGYAVGQYGVILKTNNGGISWTTQTSGTSNFLHSVYFTHTNSGIGYVVGEKGTIKKLEYVSTSPNNSNICAGDTIQLNATNCLSYNWSTSETDSSIFVHPTVTTTYYVTGIDVSSCTETESVIVNIISPPTLTISGNKTICSGTSTTISASGANNYLWSNGQTLSSITVSPTITTTYIVTISNCFAVTAQSIITVKASPDITLTETQVSGSLTIFASGANSYTWSNSQTGNCITVPANTNIIYYVTGTSSNGCAATVDCAVGWKKLNSIGNCVFMSVYFTSSNIGSVVGYDSTGMGIIIRTTNGGKKWLNQTPGIIDPLYSVFFIDVNNGYAVGSSNIFKTTDGGATWIDKSAGSGFYLYAVYFTDMNTGFVVGNDNNNKKGVILKTTDGGLNWISYLTGTNDIFHSVNFVDASIGYAVGEKQNYFSSVFAKTVNSGQDWIYQYTNSYLSLNSVFFNDVNTGYMVGDGDTISYTNDGGFSFEKQITGLEDVSSWQSVFFTNLNTGYIAGSEGIAKTINGNNWFIQLLSSGLNSIYFPNENVGYAVGNLGKIYKTTNGGVEEIKEKQIVKINNIEIYPNPANTQITIEVKDLGITNYDLGIYNIVGEEVIKLKGKRQKAQVDISGLPSGVYFVRVVNEQGVSVGKFIKNE